MKRLAAGHALAIIVLLAKAGREKFISAQKVAAR